MMSDDVLMSGIFRGSLMGMSVWIFTSEPHPMQLSWKSKRREEEGVELITGLN